MAIGVRGSVGWTGSAADIPIGFGTFDVAPQAGNRVYIFASWKDFSVTADIVDADHTWTEITEFADGAVAAGNGTGSMKVAAWYTDLGTTTGTATVTFSSTPNIAGACAIAFSKGAGESWGEVAFATAAIASATNWTATAGSNPGITANDLLVGLVGFRDDSATMTRNATTGLTATGITWASNVNELPATHLNTTTGGDMSADVVYRIASSGTASAAPTMTGSLSAAETGAALFIRQRLAAPATNVHAQAQAQIKNTYRGYGQAQAIILGLTQARDLFNRSVSNGFGTADVGGDWTTPGTSSDYNVNGSVAVFSSGNSAKHAFLPSLSLGNSHIQVDINVSLNPTTPQVNFTLYLRRDQNSTPTNYYALPVVINSGGGSVDFGAISKSGVSIGSGASAILTNDTSKYYTIRFIAHNVGTSVFLRARIWERGTSEPSTWNVETIDSTPNPPNFAPGTIGFNSTELSSNNPVTSIDNLIAQTYIPAGFGQSQALIKNTYSGHAQAQAYIKNTFPQHGQAQAAIRIRAGLGQALATIDTGLYDAYDTFTRTKTDIGWDGPANIGGNWVNPNSSENVNLDVNGSEGTYTAQADSAGEHRWLPNVTASRAGWGQVRVKFSNLNSNNGGISARLYTISPKVNAVFVGIYGQIRRSSAVGTTSLKFNVTAGSSNSNVYSGPDPIQIDTYYWMKVQHLVTRTGIKARGKVWQDGSSEPVEWQALLDKGDLGSSQGINYDFVGSVGVDELGTEFVPAGTIITYDDFEIHPQGWSEVGQAQAIVKNTYNGVGQAQAEISFSASNAHGQAQASILKLAGYGQAGALILPPNEILMFYDTFTDPDGTLLSDHTSDSGHTWSQATAWQIQDNQLEHNDTNSVTLHPVPNFTLSDPFIVHVTQPGGHLEFKVHRVDNANLIEGEVGGGGGILWIRSLVANVYALKAQKIIDELHDNMEFEVIGNQYRLTLPKGGEGQTPLTAFWKDPDRLFVTANTFQISSIAELSASDGYYISRLTSWTVYEFGQAQAFILNFKQQFGQAQALIKNTYSGHGQAQANIENTYSGLGQAQSNIKNTYFGLAQAQADIKQTYFGLGQAQANIKNTYVGLAQAQANIKNTYSGYAQSQAHLKNTYRGFSQAQSNIKAVGSGLGQAQANVKATSNGFGQAQARIKNTYFGLGQAQSDIKQIYYGLGQSQANIKNTYFGLGQSQANIKAVGNGLGQSQAWIKNTYSGLGQAQADIKQTYFGLAQAQANIKNIYTAYAQSQAHIIDTYEGLGQAQAWIEQTYSQVAQAQARIKQVYYGLGQAQANIEQTYSQVAQAQANIKNTYTQYAQAQADILQTYFGLAQAQANIEQTYNQHAQAQATILQVYSEFGQAQANIKQVYYGLGQAQANILNTYHGHGQAQATIRGNAFGQAQALIVVHDNNVHGQANAWIEATYFGLGQANAAILGASQAYSQAQANILSPGYGHAQSQANIKQTYTEFGQAQGSILSTYYGHAQAQATIRGNAFGQAQADIKQTYDAYAQAQALIKNTYDGYAQSQGTILRTYEQHGQAQANIEQTYVQHAQAQANIKDTYNGHGQAQAAIKQTYMVHAQAQAAIKQVYDGYGQAQANIKSTYNQHAQAQADIEQTYTQYAQSQALITDTYESHGQAQADIKATSNGFGQAQADIKNTYYGLGQAQANTKNTYEQFAQAQADIKQTYYQHAQANALITDAYNVYGQAQAAIKATYDVHAQAQANIKNTYSAFAQAQAKINAFGVNAYGQAQANIQFQGNAVFAQAQAKINAFNVNGYGQAQADIKATYTQSAQSQALIRTTNTVHAQAQAQIVATYQVYAQAQGSIKATSNGYGQAQGSIKTIYNGFGQAQGAIKTTYNGHAQAQAYILRVTYAHSQAQAAIKQVYTTYAQAQARILQTYTVTANAQALIRTTVTVVAQAQALITTTTSVFGQAQAYIIVGRFGRGQAQALIVVTDNNVFAQAQATVIKAAGYGQAQALIKLVHTLKGLTIRDRESLGLTISDRIYLNNVIGDTSDPIFLSISDRESLGLAISDKIYININFDDTNYDE